MSLSSTREGNDLALRLACLGQLGSKLYVNFLTTTCLFPLGPNLRLRCLSTSEHLQPQSSLQNLKQLLSCRPSSLQFLAYSFPPFTATYSMVSEYKPFACPSLSYIVSGLGFKVVSGFGFKVVSGFRHCLPVQLSLSPYFNSHSVKFFFTDFQTCIFFFFSCTSLSSHQPAGVVWNLAPYQQPSLLYSNALRSFLSPARS